MFLRKVSPVAMVLIFLCSLSVFGQTDAEKKPEPSPTPDTKATDTKDAPKAAAVPLTAKDIANKTLTVDQVVELTIVYYGYPGGRALLNQIRKTTIEKGKSKITAADGHVDSVSYERWVIRGDNLDKERIRLDQEFPNARYSLVRADDKVFGIYNDSPFTPREDASKTFENQTFRGLEALLRYKEDGSTIALSGRDKVMGVDFYVVDVTDKQSRKTRFYISSKTFRIMMLEYEDSGIKYKRKFYNYNYAQGTLVPFRSVLWADDKIIEETDISTITFGQKVDEDMFRAG